MSPNEEKEAKAKETCPESIIKSSRTGFHTKPIWPGNFLTIYYIPLVTGLLQFQEKLKIKNETISFGLWCLYSLSTLTRSPVKGE